MQEPACSRKRCEQGRAAVVEGFEDELIVVGEPEVDGDEVKPRPAARATARPRARPGCRPAPHPRVVRRPLERRAVRSRGPQLEAVFRPGEPPRGVDDEIFKKPASSL